MESKPSVQKLGNNKVAAVWYLCGSSLHMKHVPVAALYYIILKGNMKLLDSILCLHTFPQ